MSFCSAKTTRQQQRRSRAFRTSNAEAQNLCIVHSGAWAQTTYNNAMYIPHFGGFTSANLAKTTHVIAIRERARRCVTHTGRRVA